jgi:hypothetical protein
MQRGSQSCLALVQPESCGWMVVKGKTSVVTILDEQRHVTDYGMKLQSGFARVHLCARGKCRTRW